MNNVFRLALTAGALACAISAPANATITYDVNFNVDVSATIAGLPLSEVLGVDVKMTANGPAREGSGVIDVPIDTSQVTVTGDPVISSIIDIFSDEISQFTQGQVLAYDIQSNTVGLGPFAAFTTASAINILEPPFNTTGGDLSFPNALSLPFGAMIEPDGPVAFSATGEAIVAPSPIPEPSTWAMMLVGFAGLGLAGYRSTRKQVAAAFRA